MKRIINKLFGDLLKSKEAQYEQLHPESTWFWVTLFFDAYNLMLVFVFFFSVLYVIGKLLFRLIF